MKRALLLLCLALAACSGGSGGRDRSVPLQSIVGFDPARAAGDWVEVAAIGRASGGRWSIAPGGAGALTISAPGLSGSARPVGPGQYDLAGTKLVVLWAEASYRTLVIGTPDGRFATILNRDAALPADRMRAARDILEWNGYDPRALS